MKNNPNPTVIRYEDITGYEEHYVGEPDFIVKKGPITYCIQVKKLSDTERDNRRNKLIRKVICKLEEIKGEYIFILSHSKEFNCSDVTSFCEYVEEILSNEVRIEFNYQYENGSIIKAGIEFLKRNSVNQKFIRCGGTEDMNVVNVTGESCRHIRKSFEKAAEAYKTETNSQRINLILVEMDRLSHRSLCFDEAVFGELTVDLEKNQDVRFSEGFFDADIYNVRVMGIVLLTPQGGSLFCNYNKILFINERFKENIEAIKDIIPIDKLVYKDSELLCYVPNDNH